MITYLNVVRSLLEMSVMRMVLEIFCYESRTCNKGMSFSCVFCFVVFIFTFSALLQHAHLRREIDKSLHLLVYFSVHV